MVGKCGSVVLIMNEGNALITNMTVHNFTHIKRQLEYVEDLGDKRNRIENPKGRSRCNGVCLCDTDVVQS